MSSQPWNQYLPPDDPWSVHVADHSTFAQPSGPGEWSARNSCPTFQDEVVDQGTWTDSGFMPAALMLSPVQSQESQSTFTFPSSSEPDTSFTTLDARPSITSDSNWYPVRPLQDSNGTPWQQPLPGNASFYSPYHASQASGPQMRYAPWTSNPMEAQVPLLTEWMPSMSSSHAQVDLASMPMRQHYQPAPRRVLLPRTESSVPAAPPAYAYGRPLLPQTQGSNGQHRVVSSVSQSASRPEELPQSRRSSANPATAQPRTTEPMSSIPRSSSVQSVPVLALPEIPGPASEDFSDLVDFDHEDQLSSTGSLRSDL